MTRDIVGGMTARLIMLFWLMGFCVIMLSPIWLNYFFGLDIIIGLLCVVIGFPIWMVMLALMMM